MLTTALGANFRCLMPRFLIAVSTWPMIISPSRKLWWKEMVMPSFSPTRLIASSSEEASFWVSDVDLPAQRSVWMGVVGASPA